MAACVRACCCQSAGLNIPAAAAAAAAAAALCILQTSIQQARQQVLQVLFDFISKLVQPVGPTSVEVHMQD
jgi:hypothetical protein